MPVHFDFVRHDVMCKKTTVSDTGWRKDDLPPRFSAYPHTRPSLARWEWRCIILETGDGQRYRLLFEVAPDLAKWKAMLIRIAEHSQPVALVRFEDQPGKYGGGLHIHANCDRNSDLTGADSVFMYYTLPDHRRLRRRRNAWTKALFCKAASKMFHADTSAGQEEFKL